MPSVTDMMKSRPGSFFRHGCPLFSQGSLLRFLSVLRLVSAFHLPAAFFTATLWDSILSHSYCKFAPSLVSDVRLLFCSFVLSLICRIPSYLMFILSLVSDSGSHLVEYKNSVHMYYAHTAVCSTHRLLCIYSCMYLYVSPQTPHISSATVAASEERGLAVHFEGSCLTAVLPWICTARTAVRQLAWKRQASLLGCSCSSSWWSYSIVADDLFYFFIENSEQLLHSLGGTQQ